MSKYTRIIAWSEDDQKWIVNVPELAGCMADGSTPSEALANSENFSGGYCFINYLLFNTIFLISVFPPAYLSVLQTAPVSVLPL